MLNNSIEIDLICKWNNNSISLLYDNFYKILVSYSFQITKEENVSEDIIQELFSKLWERRIQFDNIATFKAYLYNSVRNMSINHIRHKKVERANIVSITTEMKEIPLDECNEEVLNTQEIYRQIFKCIDKLPSRQREIFLMCMEGKKNAESAEKLNISVETVKTHKRRAVTSIKKELSPTAMVLLMFLIDNL